MIAALSLTTFRPRRKLLNCLEKSKVGKAIQTVPFSKCLTWSGPTSKEITIKIPFSPRNAYKISNVSLPNLTSNLRS